MDKCIKKYGLSIFLFFGFVVFSLFVRTIDVAPIGPADTSVGFAGLNGAFAETFGFNEAFYKLSEYFGYACLGVAACFAFLGLWQLIKGKSIKKVDREIIILGFFYIIVIGFYILFDKVAFNYRPVMLENELEASYPSSHTMLAFCVVVSGLMLVKKYITNKTMLTAVRCFLIVILAATVIFRLFSGVHWFTDIIGGIILSLALCSFFYDANKKTA
ncbi:MAG: phosphatase PAP2 family protein [Lachnospiraceae bacterium]|nr:phosphatase PAP2 family protein [Lachnospiraceae bacterium]